MSRVFITDRIKNPDLEKNILGSDVSVEFDEMAEVLLVWHQYADRNYLNQFKNLKSVIRYGIGYDRVDLKVATEKKIWVSNNPDYCIQEVSDTTMAMVLNFSRGVHSMNKIARGYNGEWQEKPVPVLRRASETVLGIIGAGNIGGLVIKKALAFNYQILCFDPFISPELKDNFMKLRVKFVSDLTSLLKQSDIVSLHVPLTQHTESMINLSFLKSMKFGASLINTARGQLLERSDLLFEFLNKGHLENVFLDVMPEEPPLPSALIDAWRSEVFGSRLTLNPHKAYFSLESAIEMRTKAAVNAKRVLAGLKPLNIVNHF
jgi:lactate dehydrogenase-like 2-hydroxyacid dehydrogenase